MLVVVKNLLALLGAQVATWGVAVTMLLVMPRVLGDAEYGRLSFALSFVAFFAVVANLGSSQVIVKATARDSALLGSYVVNTSLIKMPVLAVMATIAIILVRVLGYPEETCLLVGIACIGMALDVTNRTFVAGLQGQQRMGRTALWSTIQQYASCAAILVALATGQSLPVVLIASTCMWVISLTGNGVQLFRSANVRVQFSAQLSRTILVGGLPFLLWSIVQITYSSVDVTLLSFLSDDKQVGWYSVADRLISIPNFIPFIVMTAFFPTLSQHGASAASEFVSLANRAVRLVFLACAPMAAGIAVVAPDLIALFHYPSGFTNSIPLIRLLAADIPLAAIGTIVGAVIFASDRERAWAVVGALGAVLNVLLNLVAIPLTVRAFSNGGLGAAAATVITEVFILAGIMYLRPSGVVNRQTLGYLGRCTVACSLMVGSIVITGTHWLPMQVAVGIMSYTLASLGLRTIPIRELRDAGLHLLAQRQSSRAASTSGDAIVIQ